MRLEVKKQANAFGVLRLISAICIIIFHYNKMTGTPHDDIGLPLMNVLWLPYIYGGDLVTLFFEISGFCFFIFKLENTENTTFMQFVRHRIKRFFPMHWIALLLVLAFSIISKSLFGNTISGYGYSGRNVIYIILDILCLNFFRPINGVAWFLEALFACQIVVFLVYSLSRKFKYYCLTFFAVGSLLQVLILGYESPLSNIGSAFFSFIIGGTIALANSKLYDYRKNIWKISLILLTVSIMGLIFVNSCLCVYEKDFSWIIESIFLFPSIIILITNNDALLKALSKINFLGKYTFTIYIFQTSAMFLLFILGSLLGYDEWTSPIYLVVTIVFVVIVGIIFGIVNGSINRAFKKYER